MQSYNESQERQKISKKMVETNGQEQKNAAIYRPVKTNYLKRRSVLVYYIQYCNNLKKW